MRKCCRRLSNPWAVHVSGRRTVTEMLDHLVAKGTLVRDPRQRDMAELCTPLLRAVNEASSTTSVALAATHEDYRTLILRRTKAFFKQIASTYRHRFPKLSFETSIDVQWPEQLEASPSSGLYIWGDVGIGKTMMLDLFELCPTPHFAKRRTHLHSFMTMLSDRLHEVEEEQRSLQQSQRRNLQRPIEVVVNEVVTSTPILCFDEFQTFDVAHAALLSAFFTLAFEKGIFLMTTSNRPPQELFHLSSTFGSFLAQLYKYCHVVHCKEVQDYRRECARRGSLHHAVFYSPNTDAVAEALIAKVERGLPPGSTWTRNACLNLYGRTTVIPRSCGGVAVFDFSEVCGSAQLLGPQDLQLLARDFHTLVILNVPQIGVVTKNAAKQFIILIDELYQARAKLFFTCTVDWQRVVDTIDCQTGRTSLSFDEYTEGTDERSGGALDPTQQQSNEEVLSFDRILSRLHEMGSTEYLFSDHAFFKITDFDIAKSLAP